jgi:hypothetical protein
VGETQDPEASESAADSRPRGRPPRPGARGEPLPRRRPRGRVAEPFRRPPRRRLRARAPDPRGRAASSGDPFPSTAGRSTSRGRGPARSAPTRREEHRARAVRRGWVIPARKQVEGRGRPRLKVRRSAPPEEIGLHPIGEQHAVECLSRTTSSRLHFFFGRSVRSRAGCAGATGAARCSDRRWRCSTLPATFA